MYGQMWYLSTLYKYMYIASVSGIARSLLLAGYLLYASHSNTPSLIWWQYNSSLSPLSNSVSLHYKKLTNVFHMTFDMVKSA